MKVHRRSTFAAGEAWVPPPPSAAPAAGGWGKPVSRRVHRVAFVWCPAGGASEAAALLVRFLSTARFPSGGGAPWSLTVSRASSWSPEIGGFPRLRSRPDLGAVDLVADGSSSASSLGGGIDGGCGKEEWLGPGGAAPVVHRQQLRRGAAEGHGSVFYREKAIPDCGEVAAGRLRLRRRRGRDLRSLVLFLFVFCTCSSTMYAVCGFV